MASADMTASVVAAVSLGVRALYARVKAVI
jgi:hypothetical protein